MSRVSFFEVFPKQLNGLEGEFVTVYHVAQIYDQQIYQGEKAIALYQDALRLARELNDMRAQIYGLLPLGERYSISGLYSEAINVYQMAIDLYENHSPEAGVRVSGTREQDLLMAIALDNSLGSFPGNIRQTYVVGTFFLSPLRFPSAQLQVC